MWLTGPSLCVFLLPSRTLRTQCMSITTPCYRLPASFNRHTLYWLSCLEPTALFWQILTSSVRGWYQSPSGLPMVLVRLFGYHSVAGTCTQPSAAVAVSALHLTPLPLTLLFVALRQRWYPQG